MSDTLSDEDDMDGTINLFANLAFPVYEGQYAKEKMADVAQELQRWRAAFEWLLLIDGRVAVFGRTGGEQSWFARENSLQGNLTYGATALEAIEALRAKVEVKP